MKHSKITNIEIKDSLADIYKALQILSNNGQILADKAFQQEVILSLILEHDKKLNEFVKNRLKEVEQRKSQDKK